MVVTEEEVVEEIVVDVITFIIMDQGMQVVGEEASIVMIIAIEAGRQERIAVDTMDHLKGMIVGRTEEVDIEMTAIMDSITMAMMRSFEAVKEGITIGMIIHLDASAMILVDGGGVLAVHHQTWSVVATIRGGNIQGSTIGIMTRGGAVQGDTIVRTMVATRVVETRETTATADPEMTMIAGGIVIGTMMNEGIERSTIATMETELAMIEMTAAIVGTRNESTRKSADGVAVEALAS